MRILYIGDIFGRPGRRAVKELVPKLREQHGIDLVLANADNACHGNGLDLPTYEELREAGIEWMAGGDHIWSVRAFLPFLDDPKIHVLRPENYPPGVPGRGAATFVVNGETITFIHLIGQVFTRPDQLENPFHAFDALIEQAKGFVVVDFHAEATSEKVVFGHYVDGRAGAALGTHTHVQTADERLLPKGTAYISDVGMTGPQNGSIGAKLEGVLPGFLKGMPIKLEPADGPIQFNAVILETEAGKATSIERIFRILD